MAAIRVEVRLECESRADADAASAELYHAFGLNVALKPPREGREGIWFVYGACAFDPDAPRPTLTEVIVPTTGETVQAVIRRTPAIAAPPRRPRSWEEEG
jgi:hypothetical protein